MDYCKTFCVSVMRGSSKSFSVYLTETGWFVEAEPASLDALHLGSHETEKDLMWADWEVFVSQLQQQKLVQYG